MKLEYYYDKFPQIRTATLKVINQKNLIFIYKPLLDTREEKIYTQSSMLAKKQAL